MAHPLSMLVEHMGALESIPEGERTRDWFQIYAYDLTKMREWLDEYGAYINDMVRRLAPPPAEGSDR